MKPTNKGEAIVEEVRVVAVKQEEQGIVIVHCRFEGEGAIRIWRSTYLNDCGGSHRSRLLHAENISLYPYWTPVTSGGHTFTLYFESLPAACKTFDLKEVIPQEGGFLVKGISRNEMDIYKVGIE
jgi:hypothetical protein